MCYHIVRYSLPVVYLINENCLFNIYLDLPPISTNPYVNVSLEYSDTTSFKPLEPVFKCLFDEPDGGSYWYDTYWYINTDLVKVVESQPYTSNQSWLYPKDWVDTYNLNMVVRHFHIYNFCSCKNIPVVLKICQFKTIVLHVKRKITEYEGTLHFYNSPVSFPICLLHVTINYQNGFSVLFPIASRSRQLRQA